MGAQEKALLSLHYMVLLFICSEKCSPVGVINVMMSSHCSGPTYISEMGTAVTTACTVPLEE